MNLYQVKTAHGFTWMWADDVVQAAHRYAARVLPNHKLAHIRSYDGKHGRRELFRAWDGAWKKTTTFSIIKGG